MIGSVDVTVDLVKYNEFDANVGYYSFYVHEMGRYMYALVPLNSPHLHFMNLKYEKNLTVKFVPTLHENRIIIFDKSIPEKIITNIYFNDLKIVATYIETIEFEGTFFVKARACDFIFYFTNYYMIHTKINF